MNISTSEPETSQDYELTLLQGLNLKGSFHSSRRLKISRVDDSSLVIIPLSSGSSILSRDASSDNSSSSKRRDGMCGNMDKEATSLRMISFFIRTSRSSPWRANDTQRIVRGYRTKRHDCICILMYMHSTAYRKSCAPGEIQAGHASK